MYICETCCRGLIAAHAQVELDCETKFWQGGGDWGDRPPPLKPMKVTLLTMYFFNSANSIRDIKPFCCPSFCTAVL